jgi:ribulose-phosphate 3-epimerase
MDGHFVPNISFGVPVIKSLRKATDIFFDAHLMIMHPQKYIKQFAEAGADHITVHIEADGDPNEWIDMIKSYGCSVGLSLKPNTPYESIIPYLDKVDMILVMTVEPGFGGQSFMGDMMEKVTAIRKEITKLGKNIHLQVDGGISIDTAPIVTKAGANSLVAGTAIFRYKDGADSAISEMKKNKVNTY